MGIVCALTFDYLDGSADDLVAVDLLLDGRRVDVLAGLARQLEGTFGEAWLLAGSAVHGQVVVLPRSMHFRTLHLFILLFNYLIINP